MEGLEENEDDVKIVVIVGDDNEIVWNEDETICAPMAIKEEPMDEQEIMDIIAAAERHGQPVTLEFDGNDTSDVTFEQVLLKIKDERLEDYEEEILVEGLEDYEDPDNYVPTKEEEESESDEESEDEYKLKNRKQRNRHIMVPPDQRKSFIDDLRQQYPELKASEKALIKSVAEIMRNLKGPKPPPDYFIMNGIMYEYVNIFLIIHLPSANIYTCS